jgi:glutamyl-tRNA synthetase
MEMKEAIFRSLRWMGLEWDEEVVYQSDRIELYKTVCEDLVQRGHAYPCFCSADEIRLRRGIGSKDRREYQYDRRCRNLSRPEVEEKIACGTSRTIRFRVPDGETAFQDAIRGRVVFQNKEIDDFIILRSDRTPVYQVAVVTDDHDMGITHVIRGDDHLSNTPKQVMLYHAMGWTVPLFAHVPMILRSDKKRLSKRHGATSVEEYKKGGFLPQALLNIWRCSDGLPAMTVRSWTWGK